MTQLLDKLQLYQDANNTTRINEVRTSKPRIFSQGVPGISVIILNLNRPEYIIPLLTSLQQEQLHFKNNGLLFEIIVGDTGSSHPEVLEYYKKCSDNVRVVHNLTYHFSRCNNYLAKEFSHAETLLFLNNDIILPAQQNTLFVMHQHLLQRKEFGIVGTVLFFPDGTVQHAGIDFFREPQLRGLPFHPHARKRLPPHDFPEFTKVPSVTGACLLMKREAFEKTGGMDEHYSKECQDVALCLAAHRLGYSVGLLNAGNVVHIENGTREKGEEHWQDRQRFMRKWSSYIEASFL